MIMNSAQNGGPVGGPGPSPDDPVRPHHHFYDVIVAGARVAGASTAMLMARAGLRVLVVDPVSAARDPLSTHALMRGAIVQLRRWGLLETIRSTGVPAIRTTNFHYGPESIQVDIRPRHGVEALMAPRRNILDPILVDAAIEAGAEVRYGWSVDDLLRNRRGRVIGTRLRARGRAPLEIRASLVVGADGIHSSVARLVNAPIDVCCRHATANLYQYWSSEQRDAYEWYYQLGQGAGEIPTHGGASCVFLSVSPTQLVGTDRRARELLFLEGLETAAPGLRSRLGGPTSGLRGFLGLPGYLKRAAGPGWALVGDAGYFKDPLTAHGITDALRDAEILARAVLAGSDSRLLEYQNQRDALSRKLLLVSDRVASLEWTMDELRELHLELNREMKAELAFLADLDLGHRRAESGTVRGTDAPWGRVGRAAAGPDGWAGGPPPAEGEGEELGWRAPTPTGTEDALVAGHRSLRALTSAG